MALIITISDLKTHIYSEVLEEITRENTDIQQAAIDAAIAEAKGFLSRYDLPKLFGTPTTDAVIVDVNLKNKVKDIVRWNLVNLGVNSISYEASQTLYESTIKNYFVGIQNGKIQPEGWPYRETKSDPAPPQGTTVTWSSNPKRNQHL